ncbi:ABA4-like family protein [Rudanella lutea]|uniref:ABA4-like family protein n=1 Tax=Rudanella lutea TaxID=451374 RepID=UPI0003788AB7|nr:ABA4-like family protein [Rudanella lutea]
MTPETAFTLANALVFPQWLLMIIAPRWRVTQWLVGTLIIPMVLAVMYLAYLFTGSKPLDFMAFSTLQGVMSLLGSGDKGPALAGWIHYLAFDLVAGSWVLRDGQQRQIHHGLLVPCLLFCFMLGPTGLLLYGIVRLMASRK